MSSRGLFARTPPGAVPQARWEAALPRTLGPCGQTSCPCSRCGKAGVRRTDSEAGVWAPPASGGRAAGSCAASLPVRDLRRQPRCREQGGLRDWARTATVVPCAAGLRPGWLAHECRWSAGGESGRGSAATLQRLRAVHDVLVPLPAQQASPRLTWWLRAPESTTARALPEAQAWSRRPGVPAAPGRGNEPSPIHVPGETSHGSLGATGAAAHVPLLVPPLTSRVGRRVPWCPPPTAPGELPQTQIWGRPDPPPHSARQGQGSPREDGVHSPCRASPAGQPPD